MTGGSGIGRYLRAPRVQAMAETVLETSLLSFLALLFFSPKASGVALILLGLSWVVRRLGASRFWPAVSLQIPALLFLISLALSVAFSEDRLHSLRQFSSQAPKMLVIFYGVLEYLRREGRWRRLLLVCSSVLLLIGIDGLVQLLQGQDFLRGIPLWRGRVRAHFSSPTFFEYPLPLLLLSLLLLEGKGQRWRRALAGLGALTFGASSALSQTRSVWIALALGVLVLTFFSYRKVIHLSFLATLALALVALPMAKGKGRLTSLGDVVSQQRHQRILAWQITYRMFLSRPLLGKGLDFFDRYQRNAELQRPYLPPALYERVREGGKGIVFPVYHPHSIYLELLASQGTVGLAAYLVVVATLFSSLGRRLRSPPPPAAGGLLASLLSFLICGAAGTSFYHFWSYGIFWLLAGMAMSLERREDGGS